MKFPFKKKKKNLALISVGIVSSSLFSICAVGTIISLSLFLLLFSHWRRRPPPLTSLSYPTHLHLSTPHSPFGSTGSCSSLTVDHFVSPLRTGEIQSLIFDFLLYISVFSFSFLIYTLFRIPALYIVLGFMLLFLLSPLFSGF